MGTAELRKEAHGFIDRADNKTLIKVLAMARNQEEEEDYTLPGSPMDLETYQRRIREARERVKAGEYTTQEDLEKEMEQW